MTNIPDTSQHLPQVIMRIGDNKRKREMETLELNGNGSLDANSSTRKESETTAAENMKHHSHFLCSLTIPQRSVKQRRLTVASRKQKK